MASLLYGSGLRVLECCRLRVQDVDFAANQIVVRGAKGDKDRITMLPRPEPPPARSRGGRRLGPNSSSTSKRDAPDRS